LVVVGGGVHIILKNIMVFVSFLGLVWKCSIKCF